VGDLVRRRAVARRLPADAPRAVRGAGLRVVGVTVDTRGAASAVRDFIGEFGVTYTILADPDMVSMDRYAVIGLPATFLLDKGGVIRHVVVGPVAEGDARFEAALRAVLQ
jgi:peroxiredoxin